MTKSSLAKRRKNQDINVAFIIIKDCTFGKSCNQSPRNLNILARLGHTQKFSLFQGMVFCTCSD